MDEDLTSQKCHHSVKGSSPPLSPPFSPKSLKPSASLENTFGIGLAKFMKSKEEEKVNSVLQSMVLQCC